MPRSLSTKSPNALGRKVVNSGKSKSSTKAARESTDRKLNSESAPSDPAVQKKTDSQISIGSNVEQGVGSSEIDISKRGKSTSAKRKSNGLKSRSKNPKIAQGDDVEANQSGELLQGTDSKVKAESGEEGGETDAYDAIEKKANGKRRRKEVKQTDTMPLATRSNNLKMLVGAHVSIAKGVENSVTNCLHIGGNAFAMFLKSQRKWENPPLQTKNQEQFKAFCSEHKYDAASHVLPHGSYLVNLAQEDSEKAKQAYNAFFDDMCRCEALGIKLYNFHPGNTGPHPRPSAIARIAKALNDALAATTTVIPVLETMAGGGNVVGSTFEDLRDIIALVDDKNRIGVCLDTCHVFAAGYDLRSPTAFHKTLDQFDKIIGIKYLRALHLNDSKAPLASHRDLHQNIGLGFLGLRAFHNVMNEKRFEALPLVLETPIDSHDENGKHVEDKSIWAREIKMLEGLTTMNVASEEFLKLERELAEKGAAERLKFQETFDRKQEKTRKALEKGQTKLALGGGRGKKRAREAMTSDEED